MKSFTKGFMLTIYLLMDVLLSVGVYFIISTIVNSADISEKFLRCSIFLVFLVFICFAIFHQVYFFKHMFFNVKSISLEDENIYLFKGKKKYTHSIKSITKVKIRGCTTTIYCDSPHKKYILDTRADSPFFTENVNTDELRNKLSNAKFI